MSKTARANNSAGPNNSACVSKSKRTALTLVLSAMFVAVSVLGGACKSQERGTQNAATPKSAPPTKLPTTTESNSPPEKSSTSSTTASAGSALFVDAACAGRLVVSDLGTVGSEEIQEASGVAASREMPGLWWVTNDSGDAPRLFLIDETGRIVTTVHVRGAKAVDWESLAVGSVDGHEVVFVADTGDNKSNRPMVTIYSFEVPARMLTQEPTPRSIDVAVRALGVTYPAGPVDAEALAFDSRDGHLYILTKDWTLRGRSTIYRIDPKGLAAGADSTAGDLSTSGEPAKAQKLGETDLSPGTLVTGLDISVDGSAIAVRAYGSVSIYSRTQNATIAEALDTTPCSAPLPPEEQGESIGFTADGGSIVTLSEGKHPTLHQIHPRRSG